jgi:signal transduction histidine kinase
MESAISSGKIDVRQRVLHALDLGMLGDWEGAKRSLEHLEDPIVPRLMSLMTEQQRREKERSEAQAVARHELGNAISIAQANIEAMVDGVLEPTAERLASIRDALQSSGVLLDDLKRQYRRPGDTHMRIETFDICNLISSQVDLISSIAEAKNVHVSYKRMCAEPPGACTAYRGDPDRIAHAVRHVLLSAVRYTPPGGEIAVECVRPNAEILLSVNSSHEDRAKEQLNVGFSLLSKLLEAVGGQARVVNEGAKSASFLVALPAVPLA